ncbi:MAG: carboxymuconolactone decarboxylase family protein [Microbacteriaceae bacterium]
MTDAYYDRDADKRYTSGYRQSTPDVLAAFSAFDAAVFAPEGREIPLKYRELIAYAVGLSKQCVYCIDAHGGNAAAAGASEGELAEAAWVAAAIGAGAAYAHGRLGFKLAGPHAH